MANLETIINAPLTLTEDGTIRIAGSRVSLDSVLHHFKLGSTAEEIAQKFPSLRLSDIYCVIAWYFRNRETAEAYLIQQEAESDEAQQKIESDPQYQAMKIEMRERLLARWSSR